MWCANLATWFIQSTMVKQTIAYYSVQADSYYNPGSTIDLFIFDHCILPSTNANADGAGDSWVCN